MTIRGTIRGRTIELLQPLPFADGQQVTVSIVPESHEPPIGSPRAILKAMHAPPHLDPADVDELERLIAEGSRPAESKGVFDDEIDG